MYDERAVSRLGAMQPPRKSRASRTVIVVIGLAAICAAAYCAWRLSSDRPPYRHVILISLDTVRADHLGCYGHAAIKTPNLDAFANEGIRFAQVVTAVPTTLASHTSMLSGTYAHTHGVPRNGFTVGGENRMLAEILSEAGFKTAGFIAAFPLHSMFGFGQGFAHFDEDMGQLAGHSTVDKVERRADAVTDAVIAYLEQQDVSDPSFVFVHYFDAHAPFDPPPPYDTMYPRDDIVVPLTEDACIVPAVERQQQHALGRAIGRNNTIVNGLVPELLTKASGEPIGDDLALSALYDGELSFLDHHVGRLLDYLKKRGIYDDALIIITADHGETMWEHGDYWNHGLWVYDTSIRVPLLVHVPGDGPRGVVVDQVVSTTDIVPSLLQWLELPIPPTVEGVSFVPAVNGQPFERGPVFSEASQPYRLDRQRSWANALKPKCVRVDRWKYIFAPYLQMESLYDVLNDPGERHDLLSDGDAQAKAKAAELRALLEAWSTSANPLVSSFVPMRDRMAQQRLMSLGYVGDDRTSDDGTMP